MGTDNYEEDLALELLENEDRLVREINDEITRGSCLTYQGRPASELAPAGKNA